MTLTRHTFTRSMVVAAAAVTLSLTATSGFAQSKRGPSSPGRITVENKRDAALVELKLVGKEGAAATERVVAKNLAPGKRVTFTLPPRSGCTFDLAGTFEDDSVMEAEDRNLCRDKVLRLVE